MSTIDQAPDDGRVRSLAVHRRRRKLSHLLEVRDRVARTTAEHRSHRLEDTEEVFEVQMSVENQIRDEFPDVFDERFADWMQQDAAAEHPAGVLTPGCAMCESIARDRGLNLNPPDAA